MSAIQLVTTVGALPNTKAMLVATRMQELALERDIPLSFYLSDTPPHGLFLKEDNGKFSATFSLKFSEVGKMLVLPIGKHLPENRIEDAANQILAMIKRGYNWQDNAPQSFTQPWGAEEDLIARRRRNKKRLDRWERNKADRRRDALSMCEPLFAGGYLPSR